MQTHTRTYTLLVHLYSLMPIHLSTSMQACEILPHIHVVICLFDTIIVMCSMYLFSYKMSVYTCRKARSCLAMRNWRRRVLRLKLWRRLRLNSPLHRSPASQETTPWSSPLRWTMDSVICLLLSVSLSLSLSSAPPFPPLSLSPSLSFSLLSLSVSLSEYVWTCICIWYG